MLLVWLFQSASAAEEMMSFICCIVLAVLSVSMGINHFMMAFPVQRKDDKSRGWMFAAAIVNFIVGVFLVVFPLSLPCLRFLCWESTCFLGATYYFCRSFGERRAASK